MVRSPYAVDHWTGEATVPTDGRRYFVAMGTDRGTGRLVNEDAVLADVELGAVVVVDGMGGHRSADVVMTLGIAWLIEELRRHGEREPAARLREAFVAVHHRLKSRGVGDSGAALVAALLDARGATVAHVGHCRAHLWQAGDLQCRTRDHTLARLLEDGAVTSEQVSQLTGDHNLALAQGLGFTLSDDIEVVHIPLRLGDRLLLTTDGARAPIDAATLAAELARSPRDAVAKLLDRVSRDGDDNGALAIVEVAGERAPAPP